jgi:hypothetical protein
MSIVRASITAAMARGSVPVWLRLESAGDTGLLRHVSKKDIRLTCRTMVLRRVMLPMRHGLCDLRQIGS